MPPTLYQIALAEAQKRARMKAQKDDAEADFLSFVKMMWPVIEPNITMAEGWILDLLCDTLMAAAEGHLTRICINVPPGSAKSSLLNVFFPAWLWGPCNRPSTRFLSISYSDRVPVRDNLRFAQIVKHPVYQACWGERVKLTREGSEWVNNDRTGWKAVTSVSGSTTGLRGDFLLLDDLNNPMDVESPLVRNATKRFVQEIMPSRVNDLATSCIINLQQRTHQEDATGVLLDAEERRMASGLEQEYTFVCVPAEFDPLRICEVVLRRDEDGEPTDVWVDPRSLDERGRTLRGLKENPKGGIEVAHGSPMARAQGESFWPERFPVEELARLKSGMTDYSWDSQFNQVPGIRGGAIIRRDWWRPWEEPDYPPLGTTVASLDTAIEEGEANDWNAFTTWGAFEGRHGEPHFLLTSAWKVRTNLADLVRMVGESCRERKIDYLLIERKTRGKDVHDEIVRLYQNASWQTVLVIPEGDKVSRLKAVSHLFSGDVKKLPDGFEPDGKPRFKMHWDGGVVWAPLKDFAEEVITQTASFPYSTHDDFVDTVSQALGWCRKNGVVLRKQEFDEIEYERNLFKKARPTPYVIR